MSLIHSPTVGLFDNSHIMHNCQFWTLCLHLTSYLNHLSLLQDCFYPLCLHVPIHGLYTCLHSIFPFAPACALHTYMCPFCLHLLVPLHPLVVISHHCTFYINILINLYIILNILINSYQFCLQPSQQGLFLQDNQNKL